MGDGSEHAGSPEVQPSSSQVSSNLPPLQCRAATLGDIQEIASLFRICKPASVWSRLGHAVTAIYFRHYCTDTSAVGVVAVAEGRVVGACLGTTDPSGDRLRFYRRSALPLVRAVTEEVVSRPSAAGVIVFRLLRGLQGPARKSLGALRRMPSFRTRPVLEPPRGVGTCYMALFFVAPTARGNRVGTEMLNEFVRKLGAKGCQCCWARASPDNVASQISQRRAGFRSLGCDGNQVILVRPVTGSSL